MENFFKKYQRFLLKLANSRLGEFVFGFRKMGHYLEYPIARITPYSVAEIVGYEANKVIVKEHFFQRPEYALKIWPVLVLCHLLDFIIDPAMPQFSFGLNTLTINPDGGATTIDGRVYRQPGGSEAFGTIRAGAGTAADTNIADGFGILLESLSSPNTYNSLRRLIALFNTSTLTSSATISTATASLVVKTSGVLNQFGGAGAVGLVGSTPASNTSLAASDYGNLGATRYTTSDLALSGITANSSTYTDWTLNATGVSNVSLTGVTKLGWRLGWDIDNSFGGSWSANNDAGLDTFFAFNGSLKPKLVVVYTLPANGNMLLVF